MTPAGWILMILAWGGILFLTAWCIARVLGAGDAEEPFDNPEPPVPPTA
ncbi:MAG TPA: hypothetical protein VM737_05850 [Gemmatimonadota bacterium]|nr:hypothetical protein [Gemmatimonadota bacterium]